MNNDTFDNFFKTDNNVNIFNTFMESNIFKNEPVKIEPKIDETELISRKKKRDSIIGLSAVNIKTKNNKINIENNNLNNISNIPSKKKRLFSDDQTSICLSENTDTKRTIFKTVKGGSSETDSQNDMKKMMRLMKNRLSARKCRQKKKSYVNTLEGELGNTQSELEKFRSIAKREKQVENVIVQVIFFINKKIDGK